MTKLRGARLTRTNKSRLTAPRGLATQNNTLSEVVGSRAGDRYRSQSELAIWDA